MPTNFELEKAYNENLLDEIQFTLQDRKEPTIVMISVPDYVLQARISSSIKERLSQYQFYDIDLTPFQVISLHQTLQEKLPKSIIESERITYCVNVFGLENSRLSSEDGQIVDSGMIAQLNFEREIIFRKPNYITILWGDHDFFIQVQRKAPDLWSWVTNFFVFKQDEIHQEKELSPAPSDIPAKLPIREEYIKSLKDKLEHLPLNDSDKGRAMLERLNLYSLLADEYAKYFDYLNAKKYYDNAIGVAEKLKITGYILNKLLYQYATLNLDFRRYLKALKLYNQVFAKDFLENNWNNLKSTYHQIGRVYEEQRIWDKALENYQKAIHWKEKTGQAYQLGSTYHQIGMVYEQQRIWDKALENYQKAIHWEEKTGQEYRLGSTYHQIGRVYEEQRNWNKALESYQNAIQWKEKTGQQHQLGGTYNHIGKVYQEQKNWYKALENYQKAIYWIEKTGQQHQLGSTYHQIGMVYQEQRVWDKALENYKKAIDWNQKTAQEHQLANTYHQIGRVYQLQSNLDKALNNYQKSIDWNKKTGQKHELGVTYFLIGIIYEEQENNIIALENFEKALMLMPEHFKERKEIIKESIQRVKSKLSEKP
ncbi:MULTISPECIES: tetratricopeptide repeat protein [unclassified Arcicella]|uniref:tetratricopeptide repeat protein n=1 Tax=unclassified Arcicella TaxID=2644986 RepID=UPI002863C010|nr:MULTISPECIES: tetratricopeptide repeat protein [unclassified Arcicella]MDR6563851.1 tetratricopeptide (TPR) repeat protein [Arcicella sp. BE51]MDR6813604.1 tetratricopeptide (TPR) repeat protein [Arcicella sp. BE140]MDR6825015.1 tetratricopeptide (TPR) repeat protein [Arcicella sp. BE139]